MESTKLVLCEQCGRPVNYRIEGMCQTCFAEATRGTTGTSEYWLEKIDGQITEILKEIRKVQLSGRKEK